MDIIIALVSLPRHLFIMEALSLISFQLACFVWHSGCLCFVVLFCCVVFCIVSSQSTASGVGRPSRYLCERLWFQNE